MITLWTYNEHIALLPSSRLLPPPLTTNRDLLALVVGAPGQGDADGAGAELPVEDHHHDFMGRGAALLQGLVGLVNKVLELLKKHMN